MWLSKTSAQQYSALRARKNGYFVADPPLTKSNLNLQIWTASLTLLAAATFVILYGGILCLTLQDSRDSMGKTTEQSPMVCFDAERHRSHTVVRVHVGTNPTQGFALLLRVDRSSSCEADVEGIRMVLSSTRVMASSSLLCNQEGSNALSALCADVILGGNTSSNMSPNRPFIGAFRLGAQNLAGGESSAIDLDGEIQLCYGTRVVVGGSRACFMQSSVPWSPTRPLLYQQSLKGVNEWIHRSQPQPCPTNYRANVSESLPTTPIFPTSVSSQSDWSQLIFASEASSMVETAYRSAREYGLSCMLQGSSLEQRVSYAIQAACATLNLGYLDRAASLLCQDQASFGYENVASKDFSIVMYPNQTGRLSVWEDRALDGIAKRAGLNDDRTALDTSLYRLGVMVLAALVMWTRKEDRSSQTDSIFISCIEMLYFQETSNGVEPATDRSKQHVDVPIISKMLGLISIGARITMALSMRERLIGEGLTRLVVCELVASGVSLFHWFQLHILRCDDPTIDRRPMLGGSAAVVDIACATMLTFADTPLTDSGDNFDDIARLLTAMLITMACVTRTVFSASCSAAGVISSRKDSFAYRHSLESLVSVVFWFYQSAQTVHVLLRLFVIPFSIKLAHRSTANPSLVSLSIFIGLLSIGACPRLTTNANSIVEYVQSQRLHEKET